MLNHDGNLMDAASIAAITALCHFRRPDVSIQGEEVTVVSWRHAQQLLPVLLRFDFDACGENNVGTFLLY